MSDNSACILTSDALEAGAGIVEKGKTTDGKSEYTLFSDGTLICRGDTVDNISNGAYIAFPYVFKTGTVKVFTSQSGTSSSVTPRGLASYNVTANGFNMKIIVPYQGSATSAAVSWIAIGKAVA